MSRLTLAEIVDRLRGENLSDVGQEAFRNLEARLVEGYDFVKVDESKPESDEIESAPESESAPEDEKTDPVL